MPTRNEESATKAADNQIDFVIVGAGPVGLLAANLIVQAGFSVRIFDIEYEPNHWGRGDWIHGRTLELLDRAGLSDELLKTGVKVDRLSSYTNGQHKSSMPFVPEKVESKHQYLLCVGQHITESTLESGLAQKSDVNVERPATVVNVAQASEDTVYPLRATVMHMRDEAARTEVVACKYLLGCDGAHSDIRAQLGIAYEGETTETHAGVLDALIRTNFQGRKDVCMLQNDHAKTVSLFPRENGLTRLFVHFDENELAIRKEQFNRNKIQLEDIQREAKRALLPHRLEFLGILYWSVYVVGQRRASAMDAMDHRVFLCGDAAHSQSPTLGQGLNSGFGDVFNLIWKIKMVERGDAHRELLNTYALERQAVARHVLEVDKDVASAAATPFSSSSKTQRDYCEVVQEHRAFTTGFGIHYNSPEAESGESASQLEVGMRAPNYKVVHYKSRSKVRLFDGVNWLDGHSVLLVAGDLDVSAEVVIDFLSDWEKTKPTCVGHWAVLTTTSSERIPEKMKPYEGRLLLDKLNQAPCHAAFKDEVNHAPVQAVVVRPDGYIGHIIRGAAGDKLLSATKLHFDNLKSQAFFSA